jgi:hypothetical protein
MLPAVRRAVTDDRSERDPSRIARQKRLRKDHDVGSSSARLAREAGDLLEPASRSKPTAPAWTTAALNELIALVRSDDRGFPNGVLARTVACIVTAPNSAVKRTNVTEEPSNSSSAHLARKS